MTPLDFIASLPHGEAKAAALTVFNLMTQERIKTPAVGSDYGPFDPANPLDYTILRDYYVEREGYADDTRDYYVDTV